MATLSMGVLIASTPTLASADVPVQSSPQGNWVGTYGDGGYDLSATDGLSGDLSALSSAAVTLSQGNRYVWDWCSGDSRSLQSPDQPTRTAAAYYNANQIVVRIAFASAYSGDLHLYAVDWDQLGRREVISVNDGNGEQTADLSSDFSQGAWMTFPVDVTTSGTITITVTNDGPRNAVLSGIFLGGGGSPPAPTAGTPTGLGGCDLTSLSPGLPTLCDPSSVWNQPVAAGAPVDPSSSTMVSALANEAATESSNNTGPWINSDSYSSSIYVVGPHQPTVHVTLDNTTAPGASALAAALVSVPIPVYARPSDGSDHVMTILQPSTNRLWEFWIAQDEADGWHAAWGGAMQGVSTSPGYYSASSWPSASWSWGAGASSLPVVGGMITVADLESGRIGHALSLAVPHPRSGTFALPAQRTDGDSPDLSSLPEGTHLRLNPSLDIDSLHLPPITAMIAKAAQTYGIVVTNKTGSTIAFNAEDPNENGLATYYPFSAPPGAGQTPWWGPAPYYGPNGGLYDWLVPSEFLGEFPWNSLQVLQMNLEPADSNGNPVIPANAAAASPGALPTTSSERALPATTCQGSCPRSATTAAASAPVKRGAQTRPADSRPRPGKRKGCSRLRSKRCKPAHRSAKCTRGRAYRKCPQTRSSAKCKRVRAGQRCPRARRHPT